MADRPDRDPLRSELEGLPCFWLYLGWRRAQAFYRPYLEEGTNPQRMYVLGLVAQNGELGVTALARALDLDVGTVSGLLSRMEREGLVERRRAAENRLEVRVRMTPAGRARYRRVAAALEAVDARLLRALKPRDVATLKRIAETLSRETATKESS